MTFVYFLINAQYTITDFFGIIKLSIFMTLDVKNLILSLGDLDLTTTRLYYTNYPYFVNTSFNVNQIQTILVRINSNKKYESNLLEMGFDSDMDMKLLPWLFHYHKEPIF